MLATMSEARPAVPACPPVAVETACSVLVVEDQPGLRSLIRWILETDSLTVETAADGAEGLAKAFARRPTLVVLDLNLPKLDGEAVARAIRAHYGPTVPVVLLSANADVASVARRVGANGWLAKPFRVASLLGAARHALSVLTVD
jgi:DNA-binding response OmpR family regulator